MAEAREHPAVRGRLNTCAVRMRVVVVVVVVIMVMMMMIRDCR